MSNTIAVVIPAYNEAAHITEVVKRIHKKAPYVDVIVVNDGSADATSSLARAAGATIVIDHIINLGKGGAAKTGCNYAYDNDYEAIILMDADGQHEPEDIPRFKQKIDQGKDIVFGYRKKGKSPLAMTFGNWFLSAMSKVLFGIGIIDTQSGYRAFTREAYRKVKWESTDYGMESEMIYYARKLKYAQIPIKRIYLDDNKGTTIIDGLKIASKMLKWKLFR